MKDGMGKRGEHPRTRLMVRSIARLFEEFKAKSRHFDDISSKAPNSGVTPFQIVDLLRRQVEIQRVKGLVELLYARKAAQGNTVGPVVARIGNAE